MRHPRPVQMYADNAKRLAEQRGFKVCMTELCLEVSTSEGVYRFPFVDDADTLKINGAVFVTLISTTHPKNPISSASITR